MAQRKVTIECTGYYELSYDDESKEFKEALESYNESIDRTGSADDMLCHIAHNLRRSSDVSDMVEGVGYIQKEGREKPDKLFSGITVEDDDPNFEYQKYY